MPTYNAGAVADTVIAYQKPITLQQGRGLRDNPVSSFEMGVGADIMLGIWHPYDMVRAGDGATGEIWSFATDGAVASVETPDFEDGWEYRLELIDVTNSGGASMTLAVYYQTSAVYSGEGVLRSFPPSPTGQKTSGYAAINRAFEASSTHAVDYAAGGVNATGVAGAGAASSGTIFYTHSIPQRIGKARISISTGTMNGGKVLLMRRKLYG